MRNSKPVDIKLCLQCFESTIKLFFLSIISTNCPLKYFKRNIIFFFWKKIIQNNLLRISIVKLLWVGTYTLILCQSCLHDVLRTKSQFRAKCTILSFSPHYFITCIGKIFFKILWKSRCHILFTLPSIEKITFYTEILTRKVELWIFSLVSLLNLFE